jgi:hypothetical protein
MVCRGDAYSLTAVMSLCNPSMVVENLTYIKNNIDKITTSRQQNMSEIRQQREIFLDQIRQIHVKINSHLDTLEHNILQELDNTGDKNFVYIVFDIC